MVKVRDAYAERQKLGKLFEVFLIILTTVFVISKDSSSHCLPLRKKCPYPSAFSPNAGKYGPEKLQSRTIFT